MTELRDVLQLSEQERDGEFLAKLGDVKDAIGDWHDWEELIGISTQLLDHGDSCRLLRDLRAISDSKYERALSLTNDLRARFLHAGGHGRRRHRPARRLLSTPVLEATAAIAKV